MGTLADIDSRLLLFFNGSSSLFLDGVMLSLTAGWTWLPLYVVLCYVIIRKCDTMQQILLIIGCAAAAVLLTAGITNLIVKPLIARPRPLNDPFLKYTVDVVGGLWSKDYSFFSAHAANTMCLATYLSLLVRRRTFTLLMAGWSLLNCYTRLYLAMHYPSDIVCGLLFGALMGWGAWHLLRRWGRIHGPMAFNVYDFQLTISMVALTLIYAALRATLS